jgi:hypothetical protein
MIITLLNTKDVDDTGCCHCKYEPSDTCATMKLLANPKPEYARNPMHTSTSPIRSVRVSGSASSPIKGLRVKAMLVIGSDRACVWLCYGRGREREQWGKKLT